MSILNIKFLSDNAKDVYGKGSLLQYQTEGSSGFDVRAVGILEEAGHDVKMLDSDGYILSPKSRVCVQLGFSMSIPSEYEMQIRPRSGLAMKHGIMIVNTPGTIDSDYRGEVGALVFNSSDEPFKIELGMRIAQAVICPVVKPKIVFTDNLEDTMRGSGGFGSTGHK